MMSSLNKLFVVLMLLLLAGCGNFSLGDSRIEGTVLDDSTSKPVEGAIVIAQWKGEIHGIVDGSSICYHTETSLTDVNGKFAIPAWNRVPMDHMEKAVTEKKRSITVYMEGYNNRGLVPLMDGSGSIRIKRATATGEKRLQDIGIGVDYGCSGADDSLVQLNLLSERRCAERNALFREMGRQVERCQPPYEKRIR